MKEDEILDDNMFSEQNKESGFILTESSTFYLFEAAKWAKIVAILIIGLKAFNIFFQLYRNSIFQNNEFSSNFSLSLISLIDPVLSIIVALFLYSFGHNFIKGYRADSDDFIDKSLINLHKYFKFSIIIIGFSILITLFYQLFENIGEVFKIVVFIIPVGLLLFYFYQNKDANTKEIDNQYDDTENK